MEVTDESHGPARRCTFQGCVVAANACGAGKSAPEPPAFEASDAVSLLSNDLRSVEYLHMSRNLGGSQSVSDERVRLA